MLLVSDLPRSLRFRGSCRICQGSDRLDACALSGPSIPPSPDFGVTTRYLARLLSLIFQLPINCTSSESSYSCSDTQDAVPTRPS
jgi:hypothetical protein